MDEIELSIKRTLESIADHLTKEGKTDTTSWTWEIKTQLTELAYETYNYNVYTSPNGYDNTTNECLYDMLWYQSLNGNNNDLAIVHLALESEWNTSFAEIKYDFYKLVQARTKHRTMIFQSNDVMSVIEKLSKIIDESLISEIGDRYLFAGWNDNDGFTFSLKLKE